MGKYFKYAIGEILLVVIGILIALQINNWNEGRKDRIKEQAYLVNLKNDVANDIRHMQLYILDRYQKKVSVLKKGKAYYQGKYQIKDTVSFLNEIGYGNVFGNVNFAFSKATYEQLVNTGDFKVFQNDSLKAAILNYYRLLEGTSESGKKKPSGYIKFTNSLAPYDRSNPEYISSFDAKFFLSKIKSEEFYKLANLELTLAYGVKDYAITIKDRANELIKLIETHIID